MAWVAWREGEPEATVVGRCGAALGHWQEMAAPFPFEWIARLLLLVVHLGHDRVDEAMAQARALADIKQVRFPDVLDAHLTRALDAWQRDEPRAAVRALRAFSDGAEAAGYL